MPCPKNFLKMKRLVRLSVILGLLLFSAGAKAQNAKQKQPTKGAPVMQAVPENTQPSASEKPTEPAVRVQSAPATPMQGTATPNSSGDKPVEGTLPEKKEKPMKQQLRGRGAGKKGG
jgi:hypothetical protein